MIAAALGYIAPVQGALPQETIDVDQEIGGRGLPRQRRKGHQRFTIPAS